MYRSRKGALRYNPRKVHKELRAGQKQCPFCHLDSREPLQVYKHSMVVKNLHPYHFWEFMRVTDHLMVIPKRHVESLHELSKTELAEVMSVYADYSGQGYNIYARESGSPAKSVPHQHTHMIKTNHELAKLYFYLRKPYFLFRR